MGFLRLTGGAPEEKVAGEGQEVSEKHRVGQDLSSGSHKESGRRLESRGGTVAFQSDQG